MPARTVISRSWNSTARIKQLGNRLLSANAYLGAEPMAEALRGGADVVITGRASDPALFLAPMIHAFGWAMDDWNLLGQGTVAGHLLECAGQITGGYFADPGFKDVPDLARLGFPDRRGRRGRLARHHQGRGLRRRGHRADLQGTVALRGRTTPRSISSPTWLPTSRRSTVEEIAPDRVRVSGGRGTTAHRTR